MGANNVQFSEEHKIDTRDSFTWPVWLQPLQMKFIPEKYEISKAENWEK